MELHVDADLGYAPRKAQVRDWLVARHERRADDVAAQLADDVEWEVVGSAVYHSLAEVRDAMDGPPDRELRITNLISHGKEVAAEGSVTTASGDVRRFAHVLTYASHSKNARIASIVSYEIPT